MSKRALIWIRAAWIAATIVLMVVWREEALVLFVPLAFLGPLLREAVPPKDQDERERTVDYRSSHIALMAVYAVLFLLIAKAQVVDGTGISPDLMLLFATPLMVRIGLSIGRMAGGRRLGLAIGFTMGTVWLAFTLASHGLSVASLAEASIGGGLLVATAVALRRPRLGGGLLVAIGIVFFGMAVRVHRGNWEMATTMAVILAFPPVLAGLALLASAQKAAADAAARETAFGTLTLPAGSRVRFDAERRPRTVFLPKDTVIEGHRCIGEGDDAMTEFHPNGRLKFCNLRQPETIDGVPCQKSTAWLWMTQHGAATTFHDNGKLSDCLLFADVTIAGQTLKAGKHVSLDREGQVITRRDPR